MSLHRLTILRAISLSVCVVTLGCDGTAPTTEQSTSNMAPAAAVAVKLQLNWVAEPEFGGFYEAARAGYFAKNGLAVELVQGGPGVPAPQLVASGKVEFAIVSAPQVIELREQGGDLVALFAVYQGNPMGIMVHESAPFASIEDLWKSDATVAIEQGLAEFLWLSKTFPTGKLKLLPWSGNLGLFAADPSMAAQCFITAEPVALALQGIKTRVFRIGETGFDPYNAVVVTNRAFFTQNRETCAKMVEACRAGWRAYLNDPKPVNIEMAALNSGMSVEAMNRGAEIQRSLIENAETDRLGLGGMRAQRWELTLDQLESMGRVKQRPAVESLFFWEPSPSK